MAGDGGNGYKRAKQRAAQMSAQRLFFGGRRAGASRPAVVGTTAQLRGEQT